MHALNIHILRKKYLSKETTPEQLILGLLKRAKDIDKNIWIYLLGEKEISKYFAALKRKKIKDLPLYGVPFAIKDNIDLANVPTTAACPAYSYTPKKSAVCVEKLILAGAIPLGKTNMDQFATGLVGTRSPHGISGNPFHANMIPGGSSSGSASAMSYDLVSFALGTDTAGSGRVPAALQNLIGVKPSKGLVSTSGIVPACRSLDCVSVFTRSLNEGNTVLSTLKGDDPYDPYSRNQKDFSARHAKKNPVIAIPQKNQLQFFGDKEYQVSFEKYIRLLSKKNPIQEIDFSPFIKAAKLLYEGPWVSERYQAVGAFIEANSPKVFPVTKKIILSGKRRTASDYFTAEHALQHLKKETSSLFEKVDLLLTPTIGTTYTTAEVKQDPIQTNSNLGYYTNFMNLLDLCALAIPVGWTPSNRPFGVTFSKPAFRDDNLIREVSYLHGGNQPSDVEFIAVCGAHLRNLPLNDQLIELGARFHKTSKTAPKYAMHALDRIKPGIVPVQDGHALEVEIWEMPTQQMGSFLALIPPPLGLGKIQLEDGQWVTSFICTDVHGKKDISSYGGWKNYLQSQNSR